MLAHLNKTTEKGKNLLTDVPKFDEENINVKMAWWMFLLSGGKKQTKNEN